MVVSVDSSIDGEGALEEGADAGAGSSISVVGDLRLRLGLSVLFIWFLCLTRGQEYAREVLGQSGHYGSLF